MTPLERSRSSAHMWSLPICRTLYRASTARFPAMFALRRGHSIGCVRMCRHGAAGAGVCTHVQAQGCRCGGVCACAGTGLQVWGYVCMCRHGAAGAGVCVHVEARGCRGVGVCAHAQARGCGCEGVCTCAGTGLQMRECARMCGHGAVGAGACAHVRECACMCRHAAADAGVCVHVQARSPKGGTRAVWSADGGAHGQCGQLTGGHAGSVGS